MQSARFHSAGVAAVTPGAAEAQFLDLLNQTRGSRGGLALNGGLSSQARGWSGHMADAGYLSHDPNLGAATSQVVPNWTRAGENVGLGTTVQGLHNAFYNSSGHRANMLGDYNQVGIGVVQRGSQLWVTFRFAKGTLPSGGGGGGGGGGSGADSLGVRRGDTWYLRDSLLRRTGQQDLPVRPADRSGLRRRLGRQRHRHRRRPPRHDLLPPQHELRRFGPHHLRLRTPGDLVVVGDWDGNGTDTPGVRRGNRFYLNNSAPGRQRRSGASFGKPGDFVIVGDWDGNGTDTLGVRRDNEFYLRNSLTSGNANIVLSYGRETDKVVVGDWNADRQGQPRHPPR